MLIELKNLLIIKDILTYYRIWKTY